MIPEELSVHKKPYKTCIKVLCYDLMQANMASWWYGQTIFILSNQVSYLLFHSLIGNSVSASNSHQPFLASHFEYQYLLLYLSIVDPSLQPYKAIEVISEFIR